MSALSFGHPSGFGDTASLLATLRKRFAPLAMITAAHALLFYVAYSGLLHRMVEVALPKAVLVSFVAPPPEAKPATPTVPKVAQLPPPMVVPPLPLIQIAPVERTITLPQPAAAPVEKASAPVAVASAAPAPAPAPGPKTITSGVEYIQAPRPVYPLLSKRMGEQGKVVLRVLVNEKGLPDQVQVQTSSGSARLDEAGRQAALRALFKPYIEDGRPVAVFVIVPLNFQLAT